MPHQPQPEESEHRPQEPKSGYPDPLDLSQPAEEMEESLEEELVPDELPFDDTALDESPADEPLPEYIDEPDFDEPDAVITEEEDEDIGSDDESESLTEPESEAETEPEPEPEDEPEEETVPEPDARPKPQKQPEPEAEKAAIDPFGEQAARLYAYLKDLSGALPPEKRAAMDQSGVTAKLDAIIEVAGKKPARPPIPSEILGVPVSPRLAKLIEFMRREKQHAGE